MAFAASLFLDSTNKELEERQTATDELSSPVVTELEEQPAVPDVLSPPQEPQQPPVTSAKLRKKWALPAFIISIPQKTEQERLIIRVDITLVLKLEPGQPIPESKRIFIRDAIYQFYTNRPAAELKRYPLARGEMIHKLGSWLNKQWPQNPIASIIFDRYQIIK